MGRKVGQERSGNYKQWFPRIIKQLFWKLLNAMKPIYPPHWMLYVEAHILILSVCEALPSHLIQYCKCN